MCVIVIIIICILLACAYRCTTKYVITGGADPTISKSSNNTYTYSLDANGKYFARTDEKGAELLRNLDTQSKNAMDAYGLNENEIKKGEHMYRNHSKNSYVHTWPEPYYDSPAFCYAYIKYKSFQRYPEIYNLVTRALSTSHPSIAALKRKKIVNVLLLGGGPGFGAVAVRDVLAPRKVSVLNIDRSDVLGAASHYYGAEFKNINFDNIERVIGVARDVDVIIASYTIRYIKPVLLQQILASNPRCIILVNHGTPKDKELMKNLQRHVSIFKLMGKSSTQFMIAAPAKNTTLEPKLIFPGIPYR